MMGDMMGFGIRGMNRGWGTANDALRPDDGRAAGLHQSRSRDRRCPDGAWDAYANAVRARHATMESMHAEMMQAKESGSALQRLDARIKAMESMVDGLKTLKPATEALYAALTDEQKKKADQLLGGRCGMM